MMMTLMIAMTRGPPSPSPPCDSDSETPDARRRQMNENALHANERVARTDADIFYVFYHRRRKEYSTFRIIVHVDATKD